MQIIKDMSDLAPVLKSWRAAGKEIALVPTMGALHQGHLDLAQQPIELDLVGARGAARLGRGLAGERHGGEHDQQREQRATGAGKRAGASGGAHDGQSSHALRHGKAAARNVSAITTFARSADSLRKSVDRTRALHASSRPAIAGRNSHEQRQRSHRGLSPCEVHIQPLPVPV